MTSSDSASPARTLEGPVLVADVLRHEADALAALADQLEAGGPEAQRWSRAIDTIDACTGHVVVSGMGKSGLVGAKISATFSSLGIPSHSLHPADAVHGDLGAIRREDVVLMLSFSGATSELLNLATILGADGVTRIGISRDHDTHLARLCDVHLALGDLDEAGTLSLAPTTSTTATLACGDALALAVSHKRAFSASDFHRRHPGGSLGAMLRPVEGLIRFRAGDNLMTCGPDATLAEALGAGDDDTPVRHAGAVVIVDDDGRLLGVFTDGDLRRHIVEDASCINRPIGEVMTKDPLCLRHDALVGEARQMVAEHRIDDVPVIDENDRVLGLVDVQDLLSPRVVSE